MHLRALIDGKKNPMHKAKNCDMWGGHLDWYSLLFILVKGQGMQTPEQNAPRDSCLIQCEQIPCNLSYDLLLFSFIPSGEWASGETNSFKNVGS